MIKRIFKKKFQTGDASLDIREESHSLGYDQNCFKCIKTIISFTLQKQKHKRSTCVCQRFDSSG